LLKIEFITFSRFHRVRKLLMLGYAINNRLDYDRENAIKIITLFC